MIRTLFLGAALSVAAPVLAQQAVSPAQTMPVSVAPAAITAAPAATSVQIASIVGREFPSYDRNADGALSRDEFSVWMTALKRIADPSLTPETPRLKTWLGAAFAQADKDKSAGVTQPELLGFLAQGRA